ncbi:MAG TPA: amino acid permease [Rhizomicrobium sp.]|nr:amino acid permease [Rhizomicrobium sp.]
MADIPEDPIAEETETELKRSLGPVHLIALGIGCIIGAGIFVLTGQAAAIYAGPGVVYSFAIAGLGCLFAGLCYSEFASMIPVAGSAYTYTYATLGKFLGWFIGWNLVLEYLAASSTVAVGWSGYFNDFMLHLGLPIPAIFNGAPIAMQGFNHFTYTGSVINLPAVALVAFITTILVIGVTTSANFNNAMVAIKLTIVLVVIFACYSYIVPANHHPFVPPSSGEIGHFGWTGVFRATGVLFFSYIGFDAVSVAAQEAKNPQRDIPIGMLGSLLICTALYMVMSYVLTGIANYTTLNVAHPVSKAVEALSGTQWLTQYVNIGAIVGLASVVLVLLLAQSRIFYAMGRDGMIPSIFHDVHPRFRTPAKSSIIVGIFSAILAGVLPLDILGQLVSIGTLLAFAIVCVGVMVLRVKAPHMKRPFRTPFVWVTAPLGIVMCVFMISFLPFDTFLRLVIWTIIGLVIYFAYSSKRARPSPYAMSKLARE